MKTKFYLSLPVIILLAVTSVKAQWEQTHGIYGGMITCMTVGTGNNNVYAGTFSGGIYRSSDKGVNWIPVNEGLSIGKIYQYVTSLASFDSIVIAGTFDNGIYISKDYGVHWQQSNNGIPLPGVQYGTICDINVIGTKIFIASEQAGVFLSTDTGATWQSANNGFTNLYMRALGSCGNVLFASNNSKLYKSGNFGQNWVNITSGALIGKQVTSIAAKDNYIYAGTPDNGIILSTDSGQSWMLTSYGLTSTQILSVHISGNNVFAGTQDAGIFISVDNGGNWSPVNTGLSDLDICSVVSADTVIIAASSYGKGIYRSLNNGNQWVLSINGLSDVVCTSFLQDGNVLYAGTTCGVYSSSNHGDTWTPRNNGLNKLYVTGMTKLGANILITEGNSCAGVFKSGNGGASWSAFNGGLPYLCNNPITSTQNYAFLGTFYGVYYSGSSWTPRNNGLTNVWGDPYNIYSLGVSGTRLFAGPEYAGVYRSDNNGGVWTASNTGFCSDCCVLAFEGNGFTAFAGTLYTGLYRSLDNGITWAESSNGLPDFGSLGYSVTTVEISGNNVFIGTDSVGVFMSADNGDNWFSVNSDLPYYSIQKLFADDRYLYAGCVTGAVWRRPLSSFKLKNVSGTVYADSNNNGVRDAGEQGLPEIIIAVKPDNVFFSTASDGKYLTYMDIGNDTLRAVSPIIYSVVNPPFYPVVQSDTAKDFGIYILPGINDLRITLTPVFPSRPGFDTEYNITFKNVGTTTKSGTIKLVFDNSLTFLHAFPEQTSVISDTLIWNFSSLTPLESRNISIVFNVPVSVPIGDELYSEAIIFPVIGDTILANNIDSLDQTVVGSFDPNIKYVFPEGAISKEQVQNKQELIYQVDFQNTGTYPACLVRIVDTLSNNLDMSSFTVLASSHPYTVELVEAGIVEFTFNNIDLPDSGSNQLSSHGFIKYSIKCNDTLGHGTPINNTAHIYFDYNAAITTNTTNTTVDFYLSSGHTNQNLLGALVIYPVPASEIINIEFNNPTKEPVFFELFTMQGVSLVKESLAGNYGVYKINISDYPNGVYFVKIQGSSFINTGKLVIFK